MKLRLPFALKRKHALFIVPLLLAAVGSYTLVYFDVVKIVIFPRQNEANEPTAETDEATSKKHQTPSAQTEAGLKSGKQDHSLEKSAEANGMSQSAVHSKPTEHHEGEQHGEAQVSADRVASFSKQVDLTQSPLTRAVREFVGTQSAAAEGVVLSQADAMRQVLLELDKLNPESVSAEELDSLAVFVFSGGNPTRVSQFLGKVSAHREKKRVLAGSIDFVLGNKTKATKFLDREIPYLHSNSLAARIYLAKSTITSDHDHDQQGKSLRLAASLGAGTLVEEASLRRLIGLSLTVRNVNLFSSISKRYTRRFPRSLYAEDFRKSFAKGVVEFAKGGSSLPVETLLAVFERLAPVERENLIVEIARKAVEIGQIELCKTLTEEPIGRLVISPTQIESLKIYHSACRIFEDPAKARSAVVALDGPPLNAEDTKLKADVLRLADAIESSVDQGKIGAFVGPEFVDGKTSTLLVSVTQQLKDTNEVLQETLK
jgi:chemotaxis protein MotC